MNSTSKKKTIVLYYRTQKFFRHTPNVHIHGPPNCIIPLVFTKHYFLHDFPMSNNCTLFMNMSSRYILERLTECETISVSRTRQSDCTRCIGCWALPKNFGKMTFWRNCEKCERVPKAALSPLVGSKCKVPETPSILKYLWSEKANSVLLLAAEYSKISKLCKFERYRKRSSIGWEILLFWKWINPPK